MDTQLLFIHLSAEQHLDSFYFLAIMNNPSMNVCVYVFVLTYVLNSLGRIPRHGIAVSKGNFI